MQCAICLKEVVFEQTGDNKMVSNADFMYHGMSMCSRHLMEEFKTDFDNTKNW